MSDQVLQDARCEITPASVYVNVPEIPKGYEFVAFRVPVRGESWISLTYSVVCIGDQSLMYPRMPRIVVRLVIPPKPKRILMELFCSANEFCEYSSIAGGFVRKAPLVTWHELCILGDGVFGALPSGKLEAALKELGINIAW